MSTDSPLWKFLEDVKAKYRKGELVLYNGEGTVESPFGMCGIMEGNDDYDGGGPFITVGFCLPDGVYAEVEDGTYGQMQGFRIYLSDEEG